MKLIYVNHSKVGGIAEYAKHQVKALKNAGVDITLISAAGVFKGDELSNVKLIELPSVHSTGYAAIDKIRRTTRMLKDVNYIAGLIERESIQDILFSSYFEYLSPLWANSYCRLSRQGRVFGAIIHDPVRDYQVGPAWWHQLSVRKAYSFLKYAFIHSDQSLPGSENNLELKRVILPHGPYDYGKVMAEKLQLRKKYGIPEVASVFLSFGHIRDNKNIRLVLKAMLEIPNAYLLVAGKATNVKQLTISAYKDLAKRYGVEKRCMWIDGYIPNEQVAELHQLSDYIILTYSVTYQSASGVLAAGAHYRMPVLASDGGGPLTATVKKYQLGVVIEPDSIQGIVNGMRKLMNNMFHPDWHRYEKDYTWENNARRIRDTYDQIE